jgi:hypothetical protein
MRLFLSSTYEGLATHRQLAAQALERYIEDEPGQSKLKEFEERIRRQVVTDVFSLPEDLAYKPTGALGRFLLTARIKTELDKLPGADRVSTQQGRVRCA